MKRERPKETRVEGRLYKMKQIIILEDLRFDFTALELAKFIAYWNEYSKHTKNTTKIIKEIAKDVGLSVDNTFLVILHLKRTKKI